MNGPLLVTGQSGVRRLNAVLAVAAVAVVLLSAGLWALDPDAWPGALIFLVSMLLTVAAIWLVLPKRYELYQDRLTLVFPLFRWHIAIDDIAGQRRAHTLEAYAFYGIRFATNPGRSLVIRRKKARFWGTGWVISPEDVEGFAAALDRLLAARSGGAP